MSFTRRLQVSFSNNQLVNFFIVLLLWSIAEGMLIFFIPVHLDMQVDLLPLVGLFLALNSFASLITDFVFGFVSEVTDYRKFFALALITSLLLVPLLIITGSYLVLAVLVILWGMEYEMFFSFGTSLYLARHAPHGEYASVSSVKFMVSSIGFFIGPVLADSLYRSSNLAIPGVLLIFYGLMIVISYIIFNRHPGIHHKVKSKHLSIFTEFRIAGKYFRRALPHMVLAFGLSAYESIFVLYGPIHFTRTTNIAGLLSGVGLLAYVVGPPIVLFLLKKGKSRWVAITASILVFCFSWFFTRVEEPLWLLLIIFLSFCMTSAIYIVKESLFIKLLAQIKVQDEDEVVSINSLSQNIAYISVALFGGILFDTIGFPVGVLIIGGVLCIATALFLLLLGGQKSSGD